MTVLEITVQRASGGVRPVVVEHSRPDALSPIRKEGESGWEMTNSDGSSNWRSILWRTASCWERRSSWPDSGDIPPGQGQGPRWPACAAVRRGQGAPTPVLGPAVRAG